GHVSGCPIGHADFQTYIDTLSDEDLAKLEIDGFSMDDLLSMTD
ncbi:unnamed protein product, partial [marine sediment metagenome]